MWRGMKTFPSPEGIAGMMKRKIIIDPWRVKKTLYVWSLKYFAWGESSSSRSSRANTPPTRKKKIVVQRYIIPTRLWSRVNAQDRHPRSARYPLPFPDSTDIRSTPLTASLKRLKVCHHRVDVLFRQCGLERGHHVWEPLYDLRARIRDRLPQVLLIRRHALSPLERDVRPVQPAEIGADLLLPVDGVAIQTTGALQDPVSPDGEDLMLAALAAPALDPFRVSPRGHHDQSRQHVRVPGPAVHRAEDLMAARPVRLHPEGGHPAGDHVHLHPEIRQVESVEDVSRGEDELHRLARRYADLVDRRPPVGVLDFVHPLPRVDVHLRRPGDGDPLVGVDTPAVIENDHDDDGGDQDPEELEQRVARDLGGLVVPIRETTAVLHGEIDE